MSDIGHSLPSAASLTMSAYRPNADMRHAGGQF
jgi:hypothetical protein